jgi:D-alanyl-D-alanine carboxypeptidase/D-alanyl-D-alanine-endopeptidase (penicillin-binding protein 4)
MISLGLKNKISFLALFFLQSMGFWLMSQQVPKDKIPGYASVSALVIDLKTGRELYNDGADRLLVPASLMKLVSTAVALENLGPDYKFTTGLWARGKVVKGTLHGDLIIEGGGDPTLGSRYFPQSSPTQVWSMVRQCLKDAGIEKLNGKILIDEHLFDSPRFPSPRLWEDMGNYYGAPPAALTFRDNTFELTLQSPPAINELCKVVSVKPDLAPLSFLCLVRSGPYPKDSAYIYGVPEMKQWEIRGSIPAGRAAFTIKGALPQPGIVMGRELALEVFSSSDLEVALTHNTSWKQQARRIGEINSPSLSMIVKVINQQSNNLMADHLLPALVMQSGESDSYWDAGPMLIKQFWQGHDNDSYVDIFDASGLSPSNAVSARFLVRVLQYMHQSPRAELFRNTLAVSGSSGTLLNMWRTPSLKGYVFAKSGSMHNVMGYAGYVFSPGTPPKAFAIMVNHHGLSYSEIQGIVESKVQEMLQ